ncbi:MAG: helix-turn-helix domain-containing protein [Propionicimonas sp.]|nr:helix-turn-helix domain-containing protein [Propionicimonas sp.]
MTEPTRRPAVPGVARAAAILHEVARTDGQTLSSIAGNVGLAKSTTSDVTAALAGQLLLTRDGAGRFHLGARIDQFAAGWVGQTSALRRFRRACERHPALAGHTVLLLAPNGSALLCVDVRLGTRPLPQTPRPGMRLSLTESVEGAELLRCMPVGALHDLLADSLAHEGLDDSFVALVEQAALTSRAPDRVMIADGLDAVAAAGELVAGVWVVVSAQLPTATPATQAEEIRASLRALLTDLAAGETSR